MMVVSHLLTALRVAGTTTQMDGDSSDLMSIIAADFGNVNNQDTATQKDTRCLNAPTVTQMGMAAVWVARHSPWISTTWLARYVTGLMFLMPIAAAPLLLQHKNPQDHHELLLLQHKNPQDHHELLLLHHKNPQDHHELLLHHLAVTATMESVMSVTVLIRIASTAMAISVNQDV